MKKYLKFLEHVFSNDNKIKWHKNKEYEVIYEASDHYVLPSQNDCACGIDKKSENVKYVVLQK